MMETTIYVYDQYIQLVFRLIQGTSAAKAEQILGTPIFFQKEFWHGASVHHKEASELRLEHIMMIILLELWKYMQL